MFEGLLQPTHLLFILVVALLVLGPKRLPEAGRGLGAAIRGFRESMTDEHEARDEPDRSEASGDIPPVSAPRPRQEP
jgi:sec-independent protein translocase protein TatA